MFLARVASRVTGFASAAKPSSKTTNKSLLKPNKYQSPVFKTSKLCLPKFTIRTVITESEEKIPVASPKDLRPNVEAVESLIGVPKSQLSRKVIIYKPTPRTTQQGSRHTLVYLKFERNDSRITESLMGWTSTTDPTGNLTLSFPDDTSAIAFAQRNGFEYSVETHEGQEKVREPRDYAVNFRFRDASKAPNDVDF